jgi:hypothetical protein
MSLTIIPDINVPLPDDFEPEEPSTFKQKVKVAAATAKVLLEAGAEIPVSTQEKNTAEDIFKAFTDTTATPPQGTNRALSTPATVSHLFAMLSDYDHQVVQEAVQLRRYVTNKLIEETGLPDARHRLKALELLGKISDVGLFSEKTEVTVKHEGVLDLENQIRNKLLKVLNSSEVVDASFEVIEQEFKPRSERLADENPDD